VTCSRTTPIFPGFETLVKPFRFAASPYEYKVTALRECPTPENLQHCETPEKAADYWRMHIARHPHFNPDYNGVVNNCRPSRRQRATEAPSII
jgi:hypothetical protein